MTGQPEAPLLIQERAVPQVNFQLTPQLCGKRSVSPRQLTANLLSHLVEVEGIVTKTSLKRPKLVRSMHYCQKTGNFLQREYRDAASQEGLPTGTAYPTRDDEGNLLETEYGLSIYKDNQVITVQACPIYVKAPYRLMSPAACCRTGGCRPAQRIYVRRQGLSAHCCTLPVIYKDHQVNVLQACRRAPG